MSRCTAGRLPCTTAMWRGLRSEQEGVVRHQGWPPVTPVQLCPLDSQPTPFSPLWSHSAPYLIRLPGVVVSFHSLELTSAGQGHVPGCVCVWGGHSLLMIPGNCSVLIQKTWRPGPTLNPRQDSFGVEASRIAGSGFKSQF